MAERLGAEDIAVHTLDSCGTAMACLGDETGLDVLVEAIDRAKRASIHYEVTRSSRQPRGGPARAAPPRDAIGPLEYGLEVATERELRFNRNGLLNMRARALLLLGRWDDALPTCERCSPRPTCRTRTAATRCSISDGSGRRRGDPNPFEALDEALELAAPYEEMQVIVPVITARAEAAWLEGDQSGAAARSAATSYYEDHPRAVVHGRRRAVVPPVGNRLDADRRPCRSSSRRWLRGNARGTAEAWNKLGCVYESADALGDSDDGRTCVRRSTG